MILLGLIIVLIHVDAKLYFLYGNGFLMFLGLTFFLLLLVEILPVIHDAANGWVRSGRDFYQIEVSFAGLLQRFVGRQDSNLLTFIVNHADFPRANALVDADKTLVDTVLRPVIEQLETKNY